MRRFRYTLPELTGRLLKLAAPEAFMIAVSTMVSMIGNLSHMGLMGFGSALVLFCSGWLSSGSVVLWGGLTLLCAILIGVMRFFEGFASHVAAYHLLASMRTSLFHSLRKLAPACLIDREKGDIISTAIADIDTIENFFAHSIGPMFTVILLPLTALLFAGRVHWMFAAALLPIYVMISIVIPLLAMKSGRNLGARYREELGDMKSLILESVYGLKDIQIFGNGPKRMSRVEEKSREMNRTAHAMTLHRQLVTVLPTFFIYLSRIMIIFVASYLALADQEELNGVIILSFVVSASFSSTQSLISVVSSLLETYAAAERYFEIMDDIPAVTESKNPAELKEVQEIVFDGVGFSYGKEAHRLIEKMSLSIRKGEKVGIIGESGAGKTTILRLLMRFWDPTEGEIRIDGEPLKQLSFHSLRSKVALVEQQTFIYDDTVAGNIALGKPEASLEEIMEAAKRAGIHNRIMRFPDQYQTRLGEFGNQLSGGEKQRIGIARILLTDPDVIVMDEPTSSLDIFHEKVLLKTLREEYGEKTIIIVSHRNSTLTDCEKIYRLENGKLQAV